VASGAERWFTEGERLASARRHRGNAAIEAAAEVADVLAPLALLASGAVTWAVSGYSPALWVDRALAVVVLVEAGRLFHRFARDAWLARGEVGPGAFVALFVLTTVGRLVALSAIVLSMSALARSTPWWPLLAWAGFVGAAVSAAYLYPLAVSPLAHRAVGMPTGPLRRSLELLAERAGVAPIDFRVAVGGVGDRGTGDGPGSAAAIAEGGGYLAGFGRHRRLVLDAALTTGEGPEYAGRPSPAQIVGAHEFGHVRCRHQARMLLLFGQVLGAGLTLLWIAVRADLSSSVTGVGSLDAAALPLWLALGSAGSSAAEVIMAHASRRQEREADAFACQLLSDDEAVAEHLRRHVVATGAELEPTGWSRLVGTHPPPAQRLAGLRPG